MWSLQDLLFILCIPLSGVTGAADVIHVSGYEGREVYVSCPYDQGYKSNTKYLCRNECDNDDEIVIKTTEVKKGRYSIHDDKNKRIFTVTISDLDQTDAGKYLCMVDRFGRDPSTAEVQLDIAEWCCVKLSELSGIVGRSVTMQCPYPPQHKNNRKFLCKGDRHISCTDMVTSQSRFTLQDDVSSSSFLVMITELKAGDAGTYWCGSDSQWTAANYTKIHLSVDVHMLVYILPATLLAVLGVLTVALVMLYKYKCYKVQGTEVSMNSNTTTPAEEVEVQYVDHIYDNHVLDKTGGDDM
ncbi:CMRF35-like molecule 5 [Dicentrarchus labrax]|uniref:Immunoglobulin domain-containing protein n=1 Tax=Dicentrarchus labrax TaxID=13489 RepID=A0A8C4HAG5_DICLA|nr:CMRF35-like molecule 5 [Dicentrarchus labrax]